MSFRIRGVVRELNLPQERTVVAYKSDRNDPATVGDKIASAVSVAQDGSYNITVGTYHKQLMLLAFDDAAGTDYQPQAADWLYPETNGLLQSLELETEALEPYGYWRLNEAAGPTAVDEMGNVDLTYNGSVTYQQASVPAGTPGYSVNLSSSTCTLTATDILPTDRDYATVEALYKGTTNYNFQLIDRAGSRTNSVRLGIHQNTAGSNVPNLIACSVWLGGTQTGLEFGASGIVDLTDGQWHHLIFSISHDDPFAIIDGIEIPRNVTELSGTGVLQGSGGNNIIMACASTKDRHLYEMAVYHEALSRQQAYDRHLVLLQYQWPVLAQQLRSRPLASWHCREASGTTIKDYGPYGIDGELQGAASAGGSSLVPNEPSAKSLIFTTGASDRLQVRQMISGTVPTTAFSFECVFQTTNTGIQALWDREYIATTNGRIGVYLNYTTAAAPGYICLFRVRSTHSAAFYFYTDAPYAINDGNPHHLGVCLSGNGGHIVLDGVNLPLTLNGWYGTATYILHEEGADNYVGAQIQLNASNDFVGNISHIQVWNNKIVPIATFQENFSATGL